MMMISLVKKLTREVINTSGLKLVKPIMKRLEMTQKVLIKKRMYVRAGSQPM